MREHTIGRISYSVRLRVARSTVMGNAKALCGGTSIRYGSHAFVYKPFVCANDEGPAANHVL